MRMKHTAYGPLCPLCPVLTVEAKARIETAMEQGWYNRNERVFMPFDDLKAGAMARMAQVDAMPPSQRQKVYVSGLVATKGYWQDWQKSAAKLPRQKIVK